MSENIIQHRSTTGTRLTPEWILDACVEVMGGIDLDPCSEPGPPFNVPAAIHYTKEDNCLLHEWRGRVFLNPPYGRNRGCGKILEKLVAEYQADRVTEALVLLKVDTSTKWWQILGRDWPWCAFNKRIKFDGIGNSAPFASALFYVGYEHGSEFRKVFREHGIIYYPRSAVCEIYKPEHVGG